MKHLPSEPLPELTLDSRKRRRVEECPCGKSNRDGKFVPYVGHEAFGYCHSCGETYLPPIQKQENSTANRWQTLPVPVVPRVKAPARLPSIISAETMQATLKGYPQNHFATFLTGLFGEEITIRLCHQFLIGTSKHWSGATLFWKVDNKENVRAGKLMLYNPATGKRCKDVNPTWVHTVLRLPDFQLGQCFFGEQQLAAAPQPRQVAIVESEKTAVILSAYLPHYIWLATGGCNGVNLDSAETRKVLAGRRVTLYPDVGAFEKWQAKAKVLSERIDQIVKVSRLLENKNRSFNWDIADEFLSYRKPLALPDGIVLNWALTELEGYPLLGSVPHKTDHKSINLTPNAL